MPRDAEIMKFCVKQDYSRPYAIYWILHPRCEGCAEEDSGPPHHLRTRGAHGAIDEPWNLLALGTKCHTEIGQNPQKFLARMERLYPAVGRKILDALARPLPAHRKEVPLPKQSRPSD